MIAWPDLGTRVTVRYRRPAGSVPPLTDAVGHLLAISPTVRVQTKTGAIVEFAPTDVVALRPLTDVPVRTSQIRALERAAAAGCPGIDHTWQDGWLLRAGHGITWNANSAVPLDVSANGGSIPAIASWYHQRLLAPRLAIPDRLLPLPADLPSARTERVLVRDLIALPTIEPDWPVNVSTRPDDGWLQHYETGHDQPVPTDVLTAVIDGELAFGCYHDARGFAVARVAVTEAPDGTRWAGLSEIHASTDPAAAQHPNRVCAALLAWAAARGATRGYVRSGERDAATNRLGMSLDFRLHHRCRYFPADRISGIPSSHA